MNDNKNIQRQEEQTKEVINEIKKEYTKTADFLEDNTDTQLKIAKELKEELKNNDFDVNIEELKALKDEITGLKAEIKRLNETGRPGGTVAIGGLHPRRDEHRQHGHCR